MKYKAYAIYKSSTDQFRRRGGCWQKPGKLGAIWSNKGPATAAYNNEVRIVTRQLEYDRQNTSRVLPLEPVIDFEIVELEIYPQNITIKEKLSQIRSMLGKRGDKDV